MQGASRRRLLAGLALCALAPAVAAASSVVDATRFGARGDGTTMNTAAIQAAIDAAAKGGGTVVFPAGTYLTGSLFVKSGVTLRLDKGVTLLGSRDIAHYPVLPTRIAGIEMRWPAALVNIVGQKGAAIVGEGTIDGDGKVFWDSYWNLRRTYEPRGLRWASDYDAGRPRLVQVFESSEVRIGGGLLMRRSGFWTLHICYSSDIVVDGVVIRNNEDGHGPSTDGIDIDSSRRILVANANIAVNDDALVMKAGRDSDGLRVARPTEDVIVRDVVVRAGAAGFTFGSETSGGFRNIEAYNIRVESKVPVGILFKSAHTRGGWGENLRLHDFTMEGVPVVMRATMNWNPAYSYASIPAEIDNPPAHWKVLATRVPPEQGRARFRDVRIWNVTARGAATAFEVDGYPEEPMRAFRFDALDIEAKQGGHIEDAAGWQFTNTRLRLGAPIAVGTASSVTGLAPGSVAIGAARVKKDPSKKSYEEQDKT